MAGLRRSGANEDALSGSDAADGALTLNQFVDTLHQTTPDSHVTVVGHSYGSVVVGSAASSGGLHAGDIITAGSPGMGVDSVADLKMDARHVWAGAAADDPISGWVGGFAHNTAPHTEEFGANQFVVDTSGHSGYWEKESASLKNQAAIVVGRYDLVGLEHGSQPA